MSHEPLALSIPELLDRQARDLGDRVAACCDGVPVTYRQLAELSTRAAGLLRSRGVRAGDRVVVLLGNTRDLPVALAACCRLGAMLVPLNPQHRGEVLRYMVSHAEPAAVLADPRLLDAAQLADVRASAPAAGWLTATDFLALAEKSTAYGGAGDPFTAGAIVYTSGTTGRSKGSVLSQAFLLYEADAYLRAVDPAADDVFWTALPMFHTNALCLTLLGGLLAGRRVVVRDGFSASRFWRQVREDGGTVVNLLGAMVPILLKTHPSPVGEHPVRLAVGGGVSATAVREFEERFSLRFLEIYGLTETGMNAARPPAAGKVGTVGRPLPNWEIRVDAAAGSDGEIQIRARRRGALFDGYWRDAERTAAAFTVDGFFRTGDLGRYDADGDLSFRGRVKDCIRRRGENISPSEVEFSVAEHPAIAECVAVPVPSELAEDEVKVVYVVHGGAEVTAEELHAFCRQRMARFMVPRYLERRDALPKTATQKVERHRLGGLGPGVHDMAGR